MRAIDIKMNKAGFSDSGGGSFFSGRGNTLIKSPLGTDVKTWSVVENVNSLRDQKIKSGFRKWENALAFAKSQSEV